MIMAAKIAASAYLSRTESKKPPKIVVCWKVRATMPSRVSQNPDTNNKATATSNHGDCDVFTAYVAAEANASMKPIMLILFGVKPIL
jgi:hypothetical protein